MELGVYKNIDLKLSTNFIYRRILLLLTILLIMLSVSYGFLIYQIRIINLKKTERYTVFQERELYVSKFYNSFNKNELIQELFSITHESKYLEIRRENLESMQSEFDSLYWYCRASDEYCLRLDSSRFYLDMYLNRLIPESDSILKSLHSDKSEYLKITRIIPDSMEFSIDTMSLHSSKKDEIINHIAENLNIIEKKIMGPTQWIVRSDRNELRLNQKIVDARIKSYHIWKKVVVVLVLGLLFFLAILFVFIISRPLEKPLPIYNSLPDQVYSAIYDDFENELTEILRSHKNLFTKYIKIIMVFPRGSFFPMEIISAFQKFTNETNLPLQVHDRLNIDNLAGKTAFILLEDQSIALLVESVLKRNFIIGEQIGILAFGDSPLKRLVANGITVIDTLFQDCEKTGFRHMKPPLKKCLRFIERNSL